MEIRPLMVGVLLGLLGILWILDSLRYYLCRPRKIHIYLIEGTRPSYAALSYGLGPLGIGLFCAGISIALPLTPETTRLLLAYLAGPFFVLGFGLAIFQPRWLTPAWLIWIVEYNYDIQSLLGKEARDTPNWTKKIRSQADLEAWVAQVRQKHQQAQPVATFSEAAQKAGLKLRSKSVGGIAIVIIALASGGGQLFLGDAFIGFIIGGIVAWLIYFLQSNK